MSPKFVRLLTMHCCLVSIFRFSGVGVPQNRDVTCPLSIKSKNFIGPKSPKPPIDIDKSPCRTLSVTPRRISQGGFVQSQSAAGKRDRRSQSLGSRYLQQRRITRLAVSALHRLRDSASVSRPETV